MSPSMRVAPDFDHFKSEPGTKYRSTGFDDGDLDRMAFRKMKAYFDAKRKASLTVHDGGGWCQWSCGLWFAAMVHELGSMPPNGCESEALLSRREYEGSI